MASWVTDDELYGAAERCATKMIEMYHDWVGNPDKHPKGPTNLPKTLIDSLRLDAEDFMFFDPQKLVEEYDRVRNIATAIGDNPDLAGDFAETDAHLVNWTGDAATEFKRRLGMIKEYAELQQTNIGEGMRALLMLAQLAMHARSDYLELVEATIAAAEHEIGEQSKRAAIAALSVASEIVDWGLNLDPKKIMTDSVGMLAKVGTAIAQYEIEGDDADVVVDHYLQAKNHLLDSNRNVLEWVAKQFLEQRVDEAVERGQPLRKPLPVYCQVDSPDFRYENFQSTRGGDPGPIAPTVEEERQKCIEEKKEQEQRDSEIDRRLNHGDKGVV